jgi:hypothetical protein
VVSVHQWRVTLTPSVDTKQIFHDLAGSSTTIVTSMLEQHKQDKQLS